MMRRILGVLMGISMMTWRSWKIGTESIQKVNIIVVINLSLGYMGVKMLVFNEVYQL